MNLRHGRYPRVLLVAGALFVVGFTGYSAPPVEDRPPAIPDRVELSIHTYKTMADGATVSAGGASGGTNVYALAGGFDPAGQPVRSLCVSHIGASGPDEAAAARSVHVWKARFELVSRTMEGITFRVDWSRETATAPGSRQVVAGGAQTITMQEGQSHTLDFLKAPDGSTECGSNLRIDVSASVAEDQRFADKRVAYDLWLVDEARGQGRTTEHFTATARHGEKVEFSFPWLRWPVPGARFSDGQSVEAAAEVRGSLRGRLRDDGSIDLYLEAQRGLGLVPMGTDERTTRVGDGGRKALRLAPGEVLNLVLPEPAGTEVMAQDRQWGSIYGERQMTTYGQDTTGPASGIEITDESIAVNFNRFLGEHTMSLRLAAREVTD